MRIETLSGLHGELVEFVSTVGGNSPGFDGFAIVRREEAPFRDSLYSTHLLYTTPTGDQCAQSGVYDMTLEEARKNLAQRVGRSS